MTDLNKAIDELLNRAEYAAPTSGGQKAPAWPVVNQAKPVTVKVNRAKPASRDHKIALILPDTQIGYRDIDGALVPFQDEVAIATAMAMAADIRPDQIINLGDFLDLPAHSKYVTEPAFAFTTQAAIERGHQLLAEQRQYSDDVVVLASNHDHRLQKYTLANAMASYGLRRAADVSGWPVLSPQFLMRTDELGIRWTEGYPQGAFAINNSLICIHGDAYGSSPFVLANKVWRDFPWQSVIHGHTHNNYMVHRTVNNHGSSEQQMVGSPGCLCRIDGHVPSYKSGVDASGRPVPAVMNWQQGVFVVHFTDNWFHIDNVVFVNGKAFYNGKQYG